MMLWLISSMGILSVDASSNKEEKLPTKITLNYKKKNVSVGDTITLKVKTVKPKGAIKRVFWSSSNKKIATVNTKGKVKVKKSGTVTIVAKSRVNKKIVAKCKLKVYKATKKLELVTNPFYTLTVGDVEKLCAVVRKPAKGAAPVEWSSLNEGVAKVSKDGKAG